MSVIRQSSRASHESRLAVAAEVHVQPKSAEVFVQILHSFDHVIPGLKEYCTIVREKRCPELKREGRFVLVVDFPAALMRSSMSTSDFSVLSKYEPRYLNFLQKVIMPSSQMKFD